MDYGYDAAGRLATVADDPIGSTGCSTRSYGYDADANRTALASYPAAADGGCSTATTPTTTTHSYDAADRIVDPGYGYDAFGATTTVPAPDAGGAAVSIGYYANDLVASQAQSGATKAWTLDPARRLRAVTDSGTGLTTTNHYGDGGDSPSWIAVSDGSWTRNLAGPAGELAAIESSTGTVALQLTNLHGDVVATADDSTSASGISAYFVSTEFGVPRDTNPVNPRYGWLGAKQRSADSLGGLVLMGVRLYDPATGRFLSVDPVPGGSANDYDYCSADPVNCLDLDGRMIVNDISGGGCSNSCQAAMAQWNGPPRKHRKHSFWGRARHFAWKYKWDIALGAVTFIPGVGEGVLAARGIRSLSLGFRTLQRTRGVSLAIYRSGEGSAFFRLEAHSFFHAGRGTRMWRIHYHRRPGIGRHRPYEGGW